jgi:hypothetical protein
MAAPGGGICQLDGLASFDQGLGTTAQNFTYSFTGALTNCQSNEGAPATAVVSAGVPINANGETYNLPKASGNGSCASSTTDGRSVIQWADGTVTIIDYHTDGVTAAVALQGSVSSAAIPPADGAGPSLQTTRFAGAKAAGPLVFAANGPDCASAGGVRSAPIHGLTGLGHQ